MKLSEYIIVLYDYNRWANTRMLETAVALTPEQLFRQHGHSWRQRAWPFGSYDER